VADPGQLNTIAKARDYRGALVLVDTLAAPGYPPIRQNAAAVAQCPPLRSHSRR
jgi:hypothetical protein